MAAAVASAFKCHAIPLAFSSASTLKRLCLHERIKKEKERKKNKEREKKKDGKYVADVYVQAVVWARAREREKMA